LKRGFARMKLSGLVFLRGFSGKRAKNRTKSEKTGKNLWKLVFSH